MKKSSKKPQQGGMIFDFDGVLADTQDTAYRVVCRVADRKGRPHPTLEYLRNHRTQEILYELRVKWWELPYYHSLARKWASQEERTVRLFPWTKQVLESVQKSFHKVWIVSSNSRATIEGALRSENISLDSFFIRGGVGVFGKSTALKNLLKRENLDAQSVGYIGDETRDIEAARAAGIRSISVTWGYQSETILGSFSPDFLVKSPEELLGLINEFHGNSR